MYTMNCKHKNKKMLYRRLPSTWKPANLWECEDCGAILGVSQTKIKTLTTKPSIPEQTKDSLLGADE